MACNARGCKMCPGKLEIACIMLFNGKVGSGKSGCEMAWSTIRRHTVFCKLSGMVILMAVNAFLMPYRVGHIPLMTGFARDIQVLVNKREFRL